MSRFLSTLELHIDPEIWGNSSTSYGNDPYTNNEVNMMYGGGGGSSVGTTYSGTGGPGTPVRV